VEERRWERGRRSGAGRSGWWLAEASLIDRSLIVDSLLIVEFLIGDVLLIGRNQQSEIINHQFNQYSTIQNH
jgi:hypothetical protein